MKEYRRHPEAGQGEVQKRRVGDVGPAMSKAREKRARLQGSKQAKKRKTQKRRKPIQV
jgi:hypothetical protein